MLVQNYQMKDGEFQSIYNLHEYLITLATRQQGADLSSERIARLDSLFETYASHKPEEKAVNYQNCRKSALLSRLLIRHKLPSKPDRSALLTQYITMFKEVASLVFDIGVYLVGTTQAQSFIALFDGFISNETNETRKVRLQLNKYKLSQFLSINTPR